MNNIKTTASALTLILALAACGGPPAEADLPEDAATPAAAASAEATPDAAATDVAAADATPTPAASETAATPTPSATPTTAASAAAASPAARPTAAAAAAPVAAAGPPPAFAQCSVCHKVAPGENGLGPSLANVFGAKAGDVAGFTFSNAMKESGLTWNQATLDDYLRDPRKVVPNTTMAFGGVKDDARRQAIIDYLKTL